MDFSDVEFLLSVHSPGQLPAADLPEIAFAGRSNVGKSSLLNTLLRRKKMVKTSARPGKTQGLNFFQVGDSCRLVDLPGYGYAKVPKKMQHAWQELITGYLEQRQNLKCVVVLIDIRHEPKMQDSQLIDWLRSHNIPVIAVYTKTDKISGSAVGKHASRLDRGHSIQPEERVLFSSLNGRGREQLISILQKMLDS